MLEKLAQDDPGESDGLDPDEGSSNDPEGAPPADDDPEATGDERDDIIKKLREENAAARIKAKRADDLQARLVASAVREGASGILEDPSDLLLHRAEADLLDDEGMPDVNKIAEAAQDLASQRPHLARRRPQGDIDQGARSEPESVDLAGMLRERANLTRRGR